MPRFVDFHSMDNYTEDDFKKWYYRNGYMVINPRFTKLITLLRTAVEKGDGTLNKETTSHDDLFDAFRMSLQY